MFKNYFYESNGAVQALTVSHGSCHSYPSPPPHWMRRLHRVSKAHNWKRTKNRRFRWISLGILKLKMFFFSSFGSHEGRQKWIENGFETTALCCTLIRDALGTLGNKYKRILKERTEEEEEKHPDDVTLSEKGGRYRSRRASSRCSSRTGATCFHSCSLLSLFLSVQLQMTSSFFFFFFNLRLLSTDF